MPEPRRVGYYVHHQGSGHLHRATALSRALGSEGFEVTVLSSLAAPEGHVGEWVRLARDDRPSPRGATARGRLHWAPLDHSGQRSRMAAVAAWIESARPALLVCDVSQEVALLARLHGVPVLSVVLPGDRSDDVHRLGLGVSEAAVGFWPPEADGMVVGVPHDVEVLPLGALSRYSPVERSHEPGRRVLVLQGSGGDGFDAGTLAAAQAQTPGWEWTVLGPGTWVDDPWPVLAGSDVVVTHAGQNALAEVAAARVPAVVVPQPRPHDEQAATARVLTAGSWPVVVEPVLPADGWAERLASVAQLDGAAWASWCDGGAGARFATLVDELTTPVATGVAVVTVVHGRREHLTAQAASLAAGSLRPDLWIVVAMGEPDLADWRPPGRLDPQVVHVEADAAALPLAAARNAGAEAALAAGADVLVFLDVDCLAGAGLVEGYAADVRRDGSTLWCGPVTYLPPAESYPLAELPDLDAPHAARPAPAPGERTTSTEWQLFWSLSFAMAAEAWREVGGFCEDYTGYGGEDTDFGQLARSRGLGLGWTGTPRAYHQHHPVESPPVRHTADIVRNATLFHDRWGWWPMGGWLDDLSALGLVERTPDGWRVA